MSCSEFVASLCSCSFSFAIAHGEARFPWMSTAPPSRKPLPCGVGKGSAETRGIRFFDEPFPPHLEVITKSGEPVRVANGALLRLVKESQENDQGREALLVHLKALCNQISFVDNPFLSAKTDGVRVMPACRRCLVRGSFRTWRGERPRMDGFSHGTS